MALRMQKSIPCINCVVLGKDNGVGAPNFTIIILLSEATPLFLPLLALPFPQAIPATPVPCPDKSTLGTIANRCAIFLSAKASFMFSRVYKVPIS